MSRLSLYGQLRYEGQEKVGVHYNTMALRGIRVVEMAGLAPAPLAGMILAGKTRIVLLISPYNMI